MSGPIDLDEQKKSVLPFMQRAQEMEKADPKIAYYCRMYAVEQAFKFERRAKEINALVSAALAQMEKDKPSLALDRDNDKFYCEALALRVFNNADKVDRAAAADKNTAKTYLASTYFIEILNQFGLLDEDLLEKQRYAGWRAAEISKALREGRPPLAPSGPAVIPSGQASSDDLPPAYSQGSFSKPPVDTGGVISEPKAQDPIQSEAPVTQDASPPSASLPHASSQGPPVFHETSSKYPTPSLAPSVQRFRPGSKLWFLDESCNEPEMGTVGQVFSQGGPDTFFCRYRVALKDRLVDAFENQLAPNVAEGDAVVWLSERGSIQAVVLLSNTMSWPPTYLLRMPDGTEKATSANELSMILPESSSSAFHQGDTVHFPLTLATQQQPANALVVQNMSYKSQVIGDKSPCPQVFAPVPGPQSALPLVPGPQPVMPPVPSPQPALPQLPPNFKPTVHAMMEAQKNAKYAVSSLNFEDVPAAVKYLQAALRALTTPSPR